jgi:hypothetical protein
MDVELIEYRVRPVTRYVVTRFEKSEVVNDRCSASSTTHGEFDCADTAYQVGYALCKADHERMGWPLDDERIQYPRRLGEENTQPAGIAGA